MRIEEKIMRPLSLCLLSLFLVFLALLIPKNCFSSKDEAKPINLENLWETNISKYLRRIDATSASSLYGAQPTLMLPVWASFELDKVVWQKQITSTLLKILNSTITLSQLREQALAGNRNISKDLLDESKSGSGKRRIFPLERKVSTKGKKRIYEIYEKGLSQLQFSYLIAFHARLLVQRKKSLDLEEKVFLNTALDFMVSDLLRPYWLEIPAWHWVKQYSNMRKRLEAKLAKPLPKELRPKSFYRMIIDEDLFLMAIAAELRCLSLYDNKALLKEDDLTLIENVLSMAEITIFSRLQVNNGFLFDIGARDEHPDHAYAGYNGSTYPTVKYPTSNVSQDISHSQRWPWWLLSFRDAWAINSTNYKKYDKLLDRLAYQFANHVVVWQENGFPLVTNYLNGQNGWYRVGYMKRPNFGYGPFELSQTVLRGSWGMLGSRNEDIRIFNERIFQMLESENPNIVEFKRRYYGIKKGSKKEPYLLLIAYLLREI